MRRFLVLLIALLWVPALVTAQQPPVDSPLLDHLVGRWVLQGTIAGQQTTHDIDAEWVLDHHYLRIHEISREKNSQGKPGYEATVFIAWNGASKKFAAVWLDVYGGLAAESIGVADPKENELLFNFRDEKGELTTSNDFLFDPQTDTWQWNIDNYDKGVAKPFARVTLRRAQAARR